MLRDADAILIDLRAQCLTRIVADRTLRLRHVARPNAEQAELLAGLKLTLLERLFAHWRANLTSLVTQGELTV